MKWLDNPAFVRRATIIVTALIVLAVIAVSILAFAVFQSENRTTERNAAPTSGAVRHQPKATSTPVVLEYATPTRMPHTNLNGPIGTPVATLTTKATPVPASAPSATPAGALPSDAVTQPVLAHPTFEPTTQPCSNCHDNLRSPQ